MKIKNKIVESAMKKALNIDSVDSFLVAQAIRNLNENDLYAIAEDEDTNTIEGIIELISFDAINDYQLMITSELVPFNVDDGMLCDKFIFVLDDNNFEFSTFLGHRIVCRGFTGEPSRQQRLEHINGFFKANKKMKLDRQQLRYVTHNIGNVTHNQYIKKPVLADLLYSLLSDKSSVESTDNFDEWCEEFGYNNDSIKALNVYDAIKKDTKKIKKVYSKNLLERMHILLSQY